MANRRQRLSQAMLRSTTQRLGSTTNYLHVDPAADTLQSLSELRSLIAAIGVKLQQERKKPEHRAHQHYPAVAVLDVGSMNNGTQQKTFGIYRDMTLLALDLLASVIPARIDREPPFSALLTLWLSMIAAVGLASRPASSRHFTYSA